MTLSFRFMQESLTRPGQLSQDGHWYWDGARWVAALSPDGRYRWTGSAWAPVTEVSSSHTFSDVTLSIRAPWWQKATVVGLCAFFFLTALVARLTLRDGWQTVLALIGAAGGGGLVPAVANSFVMRFELRGDRLWWITTGRKRDCLAQDIAVMRLSLPASGMSRCAFVCRDGSLAFGRRIAWSEGGLLQLARSVRVPVERLSHSYWSSNW